MYPRGGGGLRYRTVPLNTGILEKVLLCFRESLRRYRRREPLVSAWIGTYYLLELHLFYTTRHRRHVASRLTNPPHPSIAMFRPSLQRTLWSWPAPRPSSRLFSSQSLPLRAQQQPAPYQAPDQTQALPTTEKRNPHREVYKQGGMGRPVARNFLIAMATFQVLYWTWLKLESIEIKQEKLEELKGLESEVKSLTGFKGK